MALQYVVVSFGTQKHCGDFREQHVCWVVTGQKQHWWLFFTHQ
jgi:hypothetical protein